MYDIEPLLTVPLTYDVSPWGGAYCEYEMRTDAGGLAYGVPIIKGCPAANEVNGRIQAFADELGSGFFEREGDAEFYSTAQHEISFWGDNVSIVYFKKWGEYLDDPVREPYARIDLNLLTGEDVDPYTFLPEDWWERDFSVYDIYPVPQEKISVPPARDAYGNILILFDNVEFTVKEPDGHEYKVSIPIDADFF
jgi:hypothetical protein